MKPSSTKSAGAEGSATSRWSSIMPLASWSGQPKAGARKVVQSFFEQLGPERCAQISHVSSDGAEWIGFPIATEQKTTLTA